MKLRTALAALLATVGLVVAVPPPALAGGLPGGNRTYAINVKTGDLDGAGTNAWVQIRMHGSLGSTDWIVLDDDHDNHESGRLDRYQVKHQDIGTLQSIDVWCDHSGRSADWYLDWILISKSSTDGNLFSYGGWFTKNQIVNVENSSA
jgi:hypothetical protein